VLVSPPKTSELAWHAPCYSNGMRFAADIQNDLRDARDAIAKRPSLLTLPALAIAQGLLINTLVILAATHASALTLAAHYVKLLIALS